MSNMFYSLEGGEGVGKSTVLKKVAKQLEELGYEVLITREPGGVKSSEEIRNIILCNDISQDSEILLFAAARKEHMEKKIIPAIRDNKIVLCDRFVDSSFVYQGMTRNGNFQKVKLVNDMIIADMYPTKTFLLDLKPQIALKRLNNNNRATNRFDEMDMEFHNEVYSSYNVLADKYAQRIHKVNANRKVEEIAKDIVEEIVLNIKNRK